MRSETLVLLLWALALPATAQPQSDDDARDEEAAGGLEHAAEASDTGERDSGHDVAAHATRAEVHAALARFADEPAVARVVAAALDAMGPDPTAALASRARDAGWVPRVGLSVRRGQAIDLTEGSGSTADGLRLSTDDDLTLGARLSFELDRVVFRREEVALSREQRAREQARRERARQVVQVYYLRRRLQVEAALSPGLDPARELRIAELEAVLDAFTNGAFQRMMGATRERERQWTTDVNTGATPPPWPPRSSSKATPSRERRATSPRAGSR